MGKGSGGGGQTTSTVTNSNIPEYGRPYVENMLGATQKQIFKGGEQPNGEFGITGFQPYKAYGGTYDAQGNQTSYDPSKSVAGFQPLQERAMQMANGPQGFADNIGGYMTPYMQNVVDIQKREAGRQSGIMGQQQQAQAAQVGAFGGSRDAIMRAERERNLGMQMGDIQAQGSQAAFQNAQNQFNTNLGQMSTMGGQQQALEQQKINQSMTDYANTQQYPLMQLGTLSNMLRGLPMQASTTNQYAAAPNALTQGIGAAGAGASLYNAMRPYASGGIASVPRYDVGGSVESTLENMDIDALKRELKGSPSPSVKRMAQRILAEKQMSQTPRMAGGGIVAFAPGGMAGANEGSAGEEEARAGMQERLAQPPAGIMGMASAPAPAAAPPVGTAPADIISNAQNAYKTQQDIANKPLVDLVEEDRALRKSMGVDKSEGRQQYMTEQMAERANLKDEAERQKNMRLAQFFASWGSTPGSTLVAGMTALQKSIPGMIEDTKEAKKAKREADKIIFELKEAERLEELGYVDRATAKKERASDNAQKLQQSLVQYKTSTEGDKSRADVSRASDLSRATSAETVANIQAKSQQTTAGITADRMAKSAKESELRGNRRLDEAERANLQRSVLVAERALSDTQRAVAAEKEKDFAYKAAATRVAQTRGVDAKERAAALAEVTKKDEEWNSRIKRAKEDADLLKNQMKEVNARLTAKLEATTPPASAESVKVGGNTYSRPAGMTDTQWSDYKKSQGVK